jgi:hypothetical protein
LLSRLCNLCGAGPSSGRIARTGTATSSVGVRPPASSRAFIVSDFTLPGTELKIPPRVGNLPALPPPLLVLVGINPPEEKGLRCPPDVGVLGEQPVVFLVHQRRGDHKVRRGPSSRTNLANWSPLLNVPWETRSATGQATVLSCRSSGVG